MKLYTEEQVRKAIRNTRYFTTLHITYRVLPQ